MNYIIWPKTLFLSKCWHSSNVGIVHISFHVILLEPTWPCSVLLSSFFVQSVSSPVISKYFIGIYKSLMEHNFVLPGHKWWEAHHSHMLYVHLGMPHKCIGKTIHFWLPKPSEMSTNKEKETKFHHGLLPS